MQQVAGVAHSSGITRARLLASRLRIFHRDHAVDTAARRPVADQPHESRFHCRHQVVQDAVSDALVEDTLIAELLQVQLQAFQFDANFIRNVLEHQRPEVRLSRLWANAGKLRAIDLDRVVAIRVGVRKRF